MLSYTCEIYLDGTNTLTCVDQMTLVFRQILSLLSFYVVKMDDVAKNLFQLLPLNRNKGDNFCISNYTGSTKCKWYAADRTSSLMKHNTYVTYKEQDSIKRSSKHIAAYQG